MLGRLRSPVCDCQFASISEEKLYSSVNIISIAIKLGMQLDNTYSYLEPLPETEYKVKKAHKRLCKIMFTFFGEGIFRLFSCLVCEIICFNIILRSPLKAQTYYCNIFSHMQ